MHQKVGRRKVPIVAVGGSKGAIERAGGNARKPQGERGNSRRGHDARLDRSETVEPTLGAGERRARELIARARFDRRAIERRAAAGDGEKQLVAHRRVKRRNQRAAKAHERHSDHPLRKPREISARAVDGIDHPHLGALQSRGTVFGLLREPAGIADGQKPLPQQRIDGEIGLAHRRGGALDPTRGPAAKHVERQRAGFTHGRGEAIAQHGAIDVIGRQR